MKRFGKFLLITGAAVLAMCSTVFAGTWESNATGWYYQEDDGSFPESTWKWIDGNQDGVSECYYFDEQGYLLTSTTTPDGYEVNADGCWIENGEIQKQGEAPKDARQAYLDASAKTNELKSFHAVADIDMTVAAEGLAMDMTMTMDMKAKELSGNNMKFLADINIRMLGEDVKATMFYVEGFCYMEMGEEKIKMAMPFDEFMADTMNTTEGMIPEMEYIQDVQMSEDGNGNKILSFTSSPESLNRFFDSMMGELTGVSDGDSMSITEYSGTMTVNSDGYMSGSDVTMKFTANISGTPISYDMKMKIAYVNLGQDVDFALPSTAGYNTTQ